MLLVSANAHADTDKGKQESIHSFFSHGIYSQGARAELIEVVNWPDTVGTLRWHMPHLSNHPTRMSLIAEQGDGNNLRRWYVPVRVRWWSNAVVAKSDLPTRTLLTKSVLIQKRVNIAGHAGAWWKDIHELVGTRLTRPLKAGQTIFSSYVKRPRLLSRGDRVTMLAGFAGLEVRASGKMLSSAGLGDRVRVQNIKSKKIIEAVVVDAGTVRVISGARG